MKVLFSSNKNPLFETFTEYIEKALRENGCATLFFENRDFIIPGRIRERMNFLHQLDVRRLNKRLITVAQSYKPDLFLEAGGWNILPKTVDVLRGMNIKTALWTIDPPRIFESPISVRKSMIRSASDPLRPAWCNKSSTLAEDTSCSWDNNSFLRLSYEGMRMMPSMMITLINTHITTLRFKRAVAILAMRFRNWGMDILLGI